MELQSGRYYAVHFENVATAVDYCGAIVPHVVKRLRSGHAEGIDAPAVWFHTAGPAGCDLLMTRGAILAALEGGMRTPPVGPSTRTLLPAGAVLVLGEDQRQAPLPVEKGAERFIQLSA
jgi:hypothetical protein